MQYAIKGETIYVIEANPRASRTVPFVLALFLSAAYFAYGSVPLFGEHRMTAFFVFLGMTVGGITPRLYSS